MSKKWPENYAHHVYKFETCNKVKNTYLKMLNEDQTFVENYKVKLLNAIPLFHKFKKFKCFKLKN